MLASGTSDVQRVFLLVVNEDEGRKIGVKIWTVRRLEKDSTEDRMRHRDDVVM